MSDERENDEASAEPRVESIAKAVSDGVPVDWEGVTEELPEAQPLIEGLRFIESVAEAHRRILASNVTSSPPSTSASTDDRS